jgi:hypothetical protein
MNFVCGSSIGVSINYCFSTMSTLHGIGEQYANALQYLLDNFLFARENISYPKGINRH